MSLYEKTAHELHEMLVSKEVSSVEVTSAVIDRINAVEDEFECYVTLTTDLALETAREVDAKIASGEAIRPLEGIPMAIKDNICTDGVRTTCSSRMLENFVPPYDATVVTRFKENNIPILGKVNMDEFAMGSSTETSAFKKTKNPHDVTRVPGGSSGGATASVAAHEAVFTIGSDTGGSIRQPSAFCGVVGLKPTYGVVSRYGMLALASSLDQIGPITKDVTDTANLLNVISGHDAMDSTSIKMEYPDYTSALDKDVKGLRIGVPDEYLNGASPEVGAAVKEALGKYEDMGATVETFSLPMTEYALPTYYIICAAEASSNFARYDGVKYGYRTPKFEDLMELYKNTRSEGFGSEVQRRIMLGTYVLSSGYYDAYYKKALKVRTLMRQTFEKMFEKYDVLVTPTTMTTAFKFGAKVDPIEMYLSDICTASMNIVGIPAMSMPVGKDSAGLPIGMQLVGNSFAEPTLIRAAHALEKTFA